MALAPRVNTGRSSLRYTSSVTLLLAWPTRWEMSSILIPMLESNDTKLCRSSRGVHACASKPAAAATRRNDAGRSPRPVGALPTCRTPDRLPATAPPSAVGRAAGSSGVPGAPRRPAPAAPGAAGCPVFVSPPARTERHSVLDGRRQTALPSRSTCVQVRPAAPPSGRR